MAAHTEVDEAPDDQREAVRGDGETAGSGEGSGEGSGKSSGKGSGEDRRPGGGFAGILRAPGALRLIGSLFVLELGSAMTTVGLPLLVMQRYGLGLEVGATLAARFLPNILLGPIAGQMVDRHDPRKVAALAALGSGVIALLFPLAGAMWQIQLLALTIGFGYMFSFPATMALRPRVIPEGSELEGNGLIVSAERIPKLLGPALAGLITAGLGVNWLFCVEAATAVAAALLLVRRLPGTAATSSAPSTPKAAVRSNWLLSWARSLGQGATGLVRMVRGDSRLASLTVTAFTYMIALGLGRTFLASYALENFAGVPGMLGYLLAAMGLGGAVGAVVAARFRGWNQGVVYVLGNALEGGCWVALCLTGDAAVAIGLLFVAGVFESVASVVYFAEVQKRLPVELNGRYYAMLVPLSDVFLVGGTTLGGAAVLLGVGWSAVLVGLVMAAPVLVLAVQLASEPRAKTPAPTAGAAR
ncbi:MFS transporter [Streptomyces sp. NBC_00237]|uniref:MFS transporter n=1 Tax=Streptomyces sp. NBC_00237 TaxID=2975687 RepID=UPI00224EB1B5|nr:MFS transporter [Streptomyces sp. NBC_00237]MCX5205041.1 MFS transporter [Streptomyces sp. NBC_00237]